MMSGFEMRPFFSQPAGPSGRMAPVSVSQLASRIKMALQQQIGVVAVHGEVSGVRIPASGHCYFTLKDEQSSINAVCFRTTLQTQPIVPAAGQQVELVGQVTAYTARSEYQIIVEQIKPAGQGELMRRFLELKEKLNAEGLFAPELKLPIPRLPRRIGLVTSATGAALRDMLQVLGRRAGGLEIFLSPCAVQGESAPAQIVSALERLQRHAQAEVIIIGRGGGSMEDLWCFNDERVVRAVAACPVPVISAVGHEIDTTLIDYAADLRAPTPSAAAELVSAHYGETRQHVDRLALRMRRACQSKLQQYRARVERCRHSWGLRSPQERLAAAMQRLDDLSMRLSRQPQRHLQRRQEQLRSLTVRLGQRGPKHWRPQLVLAHERLTALEQRARRSALFKIRQETQRLGNLHERLLASSPRAILKRGYSIVTYGKKRKNPDRSFGFARRSDGQYPIGRWPLARSCAKQRTGFIRRNRNVRDFLQDIFFLAALEG